MWRLALALAAIALVIVPRVAAAERALPSTAIYYGREVPTELLAHYDRVVVEADNYTAAPASPRATVFAYVSVGEIQSSRSWYKDVPRNLVLGRNATWNSEVVDTKNPEWSRFLLDRVIEPLWKQGYRGFFFDTLDSYQRIVTAPAQRAEHAAAIGRFVTALRQRHPEAKILFNRGFEILPHVGRIDGLVAESLFKTCDASGKNCRNVPDAESKALLTRLRAAQTERGIPITVIDYVPSADIAGRRAAVKRIADHGFDAWVTSPSLDEYGVGRVEIVPRRVLIVYRHGDEGYLGVQDACVLLAPILEWMGYAVDYADVNKPLPAQSLVGRYAGIVTLLPEGAPKPDVYKAWITKHMDAGIRVAFVEGFGFDADPAFLQKLGLAAPKPTVKPPVRITKTTDYFGFEAPPRPRVRDRPPIVENRGDIKELLRLEDADGNAWSGAVIGPWGGAAFVPHVIEERLEQERRWILDPFKFLKDALDLPPIPAPDVTTESGRRIMTAHVDGDAFVSRAERRGTPFTAEVLYEEVLKRYDIPHTVSIVEGEVGPTGMYPQYTAKLEALARKIFALPWVEMASHTYSHPFEWEDAESHKPGPHVPHLAIKGYKFSLEREIKGSVDYINTLAPPGKRVKVLLWSGNCSPSEHAVALAQKIGVFNVNGGGATRTKDLPSLTHGSAMGIPKAPGVYQVFAPVENENVYTNDWLGPFDGYRRAVETFQLNDSPRRLSTLTIYYHFYSAAKTAALVALKKVYDWAIQQETTPIYLSEYAAKVVSFQKASLARRQNGAFEIGNLGELRTVRLDPALGYPVLDASTGIAGVRETPQGRYVHLTEPNDQGIVVLTPGMAPGAMPRLLHANGRARSWVARGKDAARIRLTADVPLEIAVAAQSGCRLLVGGKPAKAKREGVLKTGETVTSFELSVMDTGEADLECR